MIQSIFAKYVAKFFPKLQRLIEKINGKRKPLTYLHKGANAMLRQEFSVDNKWESTSVNTTYMAADIVSQDSELPIKSRGSIASSNGKLPKIGMSKILKESDITNLNVMIAQGAKPAEIARKLADDSVACSNGLDERNEYNFLYALYHGYVAIKDSDNEDALLRLNFNYLDENTVTAAAAGEITISDLKSLIAKADEKGDSITKFCISKVAFDKMRQTREAKELVAGYNGQVFTDSTTLPVPNATKFKEAFADDNNGVTFEVIDRSIVLEENGKKKPIKPFGNDRVIGICNDIVGTLVYGKLAEQTNPVAGVEYTTVDTYKLISMYRLTNPLREVTSGQAICAPILEDVDQIYILDSTPAATAPAKSKAKSTSSASE